MAGAEAEDANNWVPNGGNKGDDVRTGGHRQQLPLRYVQRTREMIVDGFHLKDKVAKACDVEDNQNHSR